MKMWNWLRNAWNWRTHAIAREQSQDQLNEAKACLRLAREREKMKDNAFMQLSRQHGHARSVYIRCIQLIETQQYEQAKCMLAVEASYEPGDTQ